MQRLVRHGRRWKFARFLALTTILSLAANSLPADDWPQWLGPKRDAVWRETGILLRFPTNGLSFLWRTPIGAGYSGPAVAGGRVYVFDKIRPPASTNTSGSTDAQPTQERLLCLDERTGQVLWRHQYDCDYKAAYSAGPRATPTVDAGKVFTLGTEGDLRCLDTGSGKLLWSRSFKLDYKAKTPTWGFAAHPLIDGRKLICLVGGPSSLVVAFDKDTGREIWRALNTSDPGYCPPMIYEFGGSRQLVIWHPEALNALDPDTGALLWSQPFTSKAGLTVPTPRQNGDLLFVTAFYNGPLMMRVSGDPPSATVLWRGQSSSEMKTDGLHSIISTPFIDGDCLFGVCSYGQLRCLSARAGQRLWETFEATTAGKPVRWANAFLVKHEDRFFLANETGDLILAQLTSQGYAEMSRARLIQPTNRDCGRPVVWSHPAFANRRVYARNDLEIVCASLAADPDTPPR